MTDRSTFVLATANPDKAKEIRALFDGAELVDRPREVPEVDEIGETLEENALLKARALVAATGRPALADDTGLEVAALGGLPGVRSARWAGPSATYADNVAKLLAELSAAPTARPGEGHRARFATVAAAVYPDGTEVTALGVVDGTIVGEPRGDGGFGYDPVFVPDEGGGLTFAEMGAADKNALSHRGRAFRALAERLRSAASLGGEEKSPGRGGRAGGRREAGERQ